MYWSIVRRIVDQRPEEPAASVVVEEDVSDKEEETGQPLELVGVFHREEAPGEGGVGPTRPRESPAAARTAPEWVRWEHDGATAGTVPTAPDVEGASETGPDDDDGAALPPPPDTAFF